MFYIDFIPEGRDRWVLLTPKTLTADEANKYVAIWRSIYPTWKFRWRNAETK